MDRKPLARFTLAFALAGLLSGLVIGTSWGERSVRSTLRVVEELKPELPVDPLRGLVRAEALARAEGARALLSAGRPWAAWNSIEPFVRDPADADPAVVLLAARAAAAWTGWREVRGLLTDRPWLAEAGDGEGYYLLGRAEEGVEEWGRAAAAYARYLHVPAAARRGEAFARLAHARARAGDARGAAEAFAQASELGGPATDWLRALAAEHHATAADPRAAEAGVLSGPAARVRAAQAAARYWHGRGETLRAAAILGREAEALAASDPAAAASLEVSRGRLLVEQDAAAARLALLRVAENAAVPGGTRAQAAALLAQVPGLGAEDELVRAAAYEAGGKPGQAARSLRAALRLGAPDTPAERLRLGRLLWEAVDLQPARVALLAAAELQTDDERRAEAELLAARALVRAGKLDEGIAALKRVGQRFPQTAAGGAAWFFLGDVSTTRDLAIGNYRRAAGVGHSPHAPEALWRLGDRLRASGDAGGAAAAWGRLAREYPAAGIAARAGYEAGRIHEAAGRQDAAAAAYRAAIAADPLSYYALRAADRVGADPLQGPLASTLPWAAGPAEAAQVRSALARLDHLEQMGLEEPWREELEAQKRALEGSQGGLIALAEGLRDRGHTIEAIRMGRALLAQTGRWDERLLRVVFPLPLPELLRHEAGRVDVDPFLLAGLVRQESSWNPRARSRVGATGLAQVMPATGEWLAPGAGIRDFRTHLLTVPEVSLRMGARYLRDQLRRYDGRRDLALAAYNAGPGRADRWRRELPVRDVDAFREAIPFDETREYVKVVIRNAAVYRRLYGEGTGYGLVRDH